VPQLMVRRNINVAARYHESVNRVMNRRFACRTGKSSTLV
jgi:hypothetical protein